MGCVVCVSVRACVCACVFVSLCLCVFVSLCLCVFVSLCLCLFVSLSLYVFVCCVCVCVRVIFVSVWSLCGSRSLCSNGFVVYVCASFRFFACICSSMGLSLR